MDISIFIDLHKMDLFKLKMDWFYTLPLGPLGASDPIVPY